MVNIYLTDKIDIITTTADKWGVITTTEQNNISARVEDTNKMIRNKDGQEVVANSFIIVDKNATIKHEDKIRLRSINGEATQYSDKEFVIQKLLKAHGFEFLHWEVWLSISNGKV